MAVYYNKLFKIILGNILQYTIILVVKIILENFWDKWMAIFGEHIP